MNRADPVGGIAEAMELVDFCCGRLSKSVRDNITTTDSQSSVVLVELASLASIHSFHSRFNY
jgi:hypothetical protein